MKQVKKYRVGDPIPDNAKFLTIDTEKDIAGPYKVFFYEIKVTKKDVGKITSNEEEEIIRRIVTYLNRKLGKSDSNGYQPTATNTIDTIKARLKEGKVPEQFKKVIDNKYAEWFNTDQAKYLRPETLFGKKFDSYLVTIDDGNVEEEVFGELEKYYESGEAEE